jgi:hypothetical protein
MITCDWSSDVCSSDLRTKSAAYYKSCTITGKNKGIYGIYSLEF